MDDEVQVTFGHSQLLIRHKHGVVTTRLNDASEVSGSFGQKDCDALVIAALGQRHVLSAHLVRGLAFLSHLFWAVRESHAVEITINHHGAVQTFSDPILAICSSILRLVDPQQAEEAPALAEFVFEITLPDASDAGCLSLRLASAAISVYSDAVLIAADFNAPQRSIVLSCDRSVRIFTPLARDTSLEWLASCDVKEIASQTLREYPLPFHSLVAALGAISAPPIPFDWPQAKELTLIAFSTMSGKSCDPCNFFDICRQWLSKTEFPRAVDRRTALSILKLPQQEFRQWVCGGKDNERPATPPIVSFRHSLLLVPSLKSILKRPRSPDSTVPKKKACIRLPVDDYDEVF